MVIIEVATMMDCWVNNVGFPIIKVSLARRATGDVLVVGQERFSAAHKCNDGLVWTVPVSAVVGSPGGGADPDTLDLADRGLEKLSRATPELILNTTTLVLDRNNVATSSHNIQMTESRQLSNSYYLMVSSGLSRAERWTHRVVLLAGC